MKEIRVGVIGFGTVGGGVVKCLVNNTSLIAARHGVALRLARIADLDITTDRGVPTPTELLTTDAMAVIDDPEIDVVVELVGGCTVAREFILAAMAAGKPVVTANKALLAHHGAELFEAAGRHQTDLYYEASVAGGVPIVKALREGLAANHIESIYGILNGTCNYILTCMERHGRPFGEVLAEAQELGYAEAEPALDVDGMDAAHKATILASLAYGQWFDIDKLCVQGIRDIDLVDIRNAADAGYRIKLLAIIKHQEAGVEIRVHPTLIPINSMLAAVSDVFNAVTVVGDTVGETMFYGRGAGRDATASAVVADLVDVGLNLANGSPRRVPPFRPHESYSALIPMEQVSSRYYIRLTVLDRPRVLADVADVLGRAGISLASVHQSENGGDTVPLILITHPALEANVNNALADIAAHDAVHGQPVVMRIEDL